MPGKAHTRNTKHGPVHVKASPTPGRKAPRRKSRRRRRSRSRSPLGRVVLRLWQRHQKRKRADRPNARTTAQAEAWERRQLLTARQAEVAEAKKKLAEAERTRKKKLAEEERARKKAELAEAKRRVAAERARKSPAPI